MAMTSGHTDHVTTVCVQCPVCTPSLGDTRTITGQESNTIMTIIEWRDCAISHCSLLHLETPGIAMKRAEIYVIPLHTVWGLELATTFQRFTKENK